MQVSLLSECQLMEYTILIGKGKKIHADLNRWRKIIWQNPIPFYVKTLKDIYEKPQVSSY